MKEQVYENLTIRYFIQRGKLVYKNCLEREQFFWIKFFSGDIECLREDLEDFQSPYKLSLVYRRRFQEAGFFVKGDFAGKVANASMMEWWVSMGV